MANLFTHYMKILSRICLSSGHVDKKSGIKETFSRLFHIRSAIKNYQPDLVVGFMHSMFIPVSIAMIMMRIPLIASEHIIRDYYRNRKLEQFLFRVSSHFINCLVVISPSYIQSYKNIFHGRIVSINNPVTIKVKRPANVEGEQGCRKIALNIGRLTEQKNQAMLIQAFSIISERVPDWDLRIIGEGELFDNLQSLIEMHDMTGRIHLVGNRDDINHEYESAQLFVLPSTFESFGLVTAEALLHGLPVIGLAECDGTNVLIKHEQNGMLIDNATAESFSEAMLELMSNVEKRRLYGKQSTVGLEQFRIENICSSWVKLFSEYVN